LCFFGAPNPTRIVPAEPDGAAWEAFKAHGVSGVGDPGRDEKKEGVRSDWTGLAIGQSIPGQKKAAIPK